MSLVRCECGADLGEYRALLGDDHGGTEMRCARCNNWVEIHNSLLEDEPTHCLLVHASEDQD